MSTLPSIETILLQIHQGLGGGTYQTKKKSNFATGQMQLSNYQKMAEEIFSAICDTLELDSVARDDILGNLMELASFNKAVELNTWTFDADQRQILWMILGYSYFPGIARHAAFWNLEGAMDKGMPGGRFWYLPELRDVDGKISIYLPVAQVVDWLLDLLGIPLEEFIGVRGQSLNDTEEEDGETLIRSLYYWRQGTVPNPTSFMKYFPDEMQVSFKGTLYFDRKLSLDKQFSSVMAFTTRREFTAEKLRQEIPMTQPELLEDILNGNASDDLKTTFVSCMVDRYEAPSPKIIRQRLLFARMVQDGYVRLLKFLCPGVDPMCADPQQNKLLQLMAIYKLIYNLTLDAWRNCQYQGEEAENSWFEDHLPIFDKHRLFLSILPSRREEAYKELSELLTRHFAKLQPGTALDDHIGLDEMSVKRIARRNVERDKNFADERIATERLVDRMQKSSPWRALQSEHRYWVISQVAQHPGLTPKAKDMSIKRFFEVSDTPEQTITAILLELDLYLNGERNKRPKDSCNRVQVLLDKAESNDSYRLWEAAILQYKAKHLLATNDFSGAGKLFREALNKVNKRGYGPLIGEVARDCLAVEVANQKLIINNHEKYYREMLAGGIMEVAENIPGIEETSRWASDYFWGTLYKSYPGFDTLKPRAESVSKKILKSLMPLFNVGDSGGVLNWIKYNNQILKSSLPDVRGDSVLMLLIKLYNDFINKSELIRQTLPIDLQEEHQKFQNLLANWREALGLIAKHAPKQLNIVDFKGQTPLMLMAESGDTNMVKILLMSGADPDKQDYHGMTSLHSAIKSRVDNCVDALLDHPCKTDKMTIDGRTVLHTAAWTANIYAIERLLELAPILAWQRDSQGLTPLELVELLIERPEAREILSNELSKTGRYCPSIEKFQDVLELLEQAPIAN
jgi:hypothetical protein